MQTLTSIGRRGWSGRIASLPLSFFLFCFLCQGHRSHCASYLDQWGLETRRSAQGSASWGSERRTLNNKGTPPKKKNSNFVGVNRTLNKPERQKFKSLLLKNYLADHDEISTGVRTIEIVIKFLETRRTIFSAHVNVIKITIPKNGGHFERRAAIGRRNTLRHSTSLYHAHS